MALKYMLLAMIDLIPRTGYQLTKVFDHVLSNFWTADQRQVYHALDKLEADGWVSAELVIQENAPNKHLYSITPVGREALHQWITTPQPPQPRRYEWMAQVFFGGVVEPAAMIPLIKARLERLDAQKTAMRGHLADYQKALQTPILKDAGRVYSLRMMLFRYVLAEQENERQWLTEMLETLAAMQDDAADDLTRAQGILDGLLATYFREG